MKRFLIIRSGNIGDTIWATTFVDAICDLYGEEVQIDWVAKAFAKSLFKNDPRINHIHVLNHRRIRLMLSKEKKRIVDYSKKHPYDVLINAEHASFYHDLVKATFAHYKIGAPERMMPRTDVPPPQAFSDMVAQFPLEGRDAKLKKQYRPKLYPAAQLPDHLRLEKPYIVFTPATSNSAKGRDDNRIWPIERWRQLILTCAARYQIVLLGAVQDKAFMAGLGKLPASVHMWAGESTLDQSLAMINDAALLIAADTGTTHMAAALNTPLIALYGPSNPRITGPYLKDDSQAKLFCCYLDNGVGPYAPATPVDDAMTMITADMVAEQVDQLLAGASFLQAFFCVFGWADDVMDVSPIYFHHAHGHYDFLTFKKMISIRIDSI